MCDDAPRVKFFGAVKICYVANLVRRCRAAAEAYAAGGSQIVTKFRVSVMAVHEATPVCSCSLMPSINCELDIVTAFRQLSIRAVVGVNLPAIGTFFQGLIDTE
jgi:hypothetical protein